MLIEIFIPFSSFLVSFGITFHNSFSIFAFSPVLLDSHLLFYVFLNIFWSETKWTKDCMKQFTPFFSSNFIHRFCFPSFVPPFINSFIWRRRISDNSRSFFVSFFSYCSQLTEWLAELMHKNDQKRNIQKQQHSSPLLLFIYANIWNVQLKISKKIDISI